MTVHRPAPVTYCEGWTFRGGFVGQHGWCLDADGNVIETTWAEPGWGYLGISVVQARVDELALKLGVYGSVWEQDWARRERRRHPLQGELTALPTRSCDPKCDRRTRSEVGNTL